MCVPVHKQACADAYVCGPCVCAPVRGVVCGRVHVCTHVSGCWVCVSTPGPHPSGHSSAAVCVDV